MIWVGWLIISHLEGADYIEVAMDDVRIAAHVLKGTKDESSGFVC